MVDTYTTATGIASIDILRVHSFQDEAVAKSFVSKMAKHRVEGCTAWCPSASV